jgi:glyoxylase-like metal-dependent hydrolase (beta-lactamase superfamily II)
MSGLWIRVNGTSHAFGRELGCECGRCRTVARSLAAPPARLGQPFAGWDDPPSRAHTSASILAADASGHVTDHVLIDAGAGVVDSLVCSGLPGLENVRGVLLTHWHPDHTGGLNHLGETLKRHARRRDEPFHKIPLYCTLPAYDQLRRERGLEYELTSLYRYTELVPGELVTITAGGPIAVTPIAVAHGGVEGSVIYLAEAAERRCLFCWDIDESDAELPGKRAGRLTNAQALAASPAGSGVDTLFLAANTYRRPQRRTGHAGYLSARESYLPLLHAAAVYLVHLSGHEDQDEDSGRGWTDAEWERRVAPDGVQVARQGMIVAW